MKIAIFSDNFYPELSGITDSVLLLARELSRLGHKIDFYAPKYSEKNFKTAKLPFKEIDLGKNVTVKRFFSLPAPFSGGTARIVLPKLMGKFEPAERPDIIHSQLFFGAGLNALAAARTNKIPLIGTNHTAISEFVSVKKLKAVSVKYAVWYYNCCDFVTAPSSSVIDEMKREGFKCPAEVISNPLDLNNFFPAEGKRKAGYKKQFKLSPHTVVCAGRLSPEKNLDVIVRAAALARKKIPDLIFAVAGAGREEPELKKLAASLKIRPAVKFFGRLDKANLAKLYQASEIYAIASTSETQSLTLMQALAAGLPAIGVRARALPEYINASNGFLVKPGDASAMAERMIELLDNENSRQSLGRGAVRSATAFAAPVVAKKWEKIYSQAIKKYRQTA